MIDAKTRVLVRKFFEQILGNKVMALNLNMGKVRRRQR